MSISTQIPTRKLNISAKVPLSVRKDVAELGRKKVVSHDGTPLALCIRKRSHRQLFKLEHTVFLSIYSKVG